jgi:hypothetical protein
LFYYSCCHCWVVSGHFNEKTRAFPYKKARNLGKLICSTTQSPRERKWEWRERESEKESEWKEPFLGFMWLRRRKSTPTWGIIRNPNLHFLFVKLLKCVDQVRFWFVFKERLKFYVLLVISWLNSVRFSLEQRFNTHNSFS